MVGLGAGLVERVAVDDQGAMRAGALADTLAADPTPAIVCAQAGNVNSGACDPMAQIVALTREHGGPLRMITPQLYAWKGSKWIKRIEFMDKNKLGFWEERGYSNTAYPWRNDRYS